MKPRTPLLLLLLVAGCIPDLEIAPPPPSGTCERPPEGLAPLLEAFPPCDLGMCGPSEADRQRGRCVDANQLRPEQIALLGSCDTPHASYCVPNELLVTNGDMQPESCSSRNGAEGRCMSLCIPQIAAKSSQLPRATCAEGELCAPCFDPITGESTGACDATVCDAPRSPDPVLFERCCEGRAVCVPTEIVPEDKRSSLSQADCADEDTLCVPEENTDPAYRPPACTTFLNGPGACTSVCVDAAKLFARRDCADPDHRCVPCKLLFEVHDLVIAKAVAGREKDLAFLDAVGPLVTPDVLRSRLADTEIGEEMRRAVEGRLARHIEGFAV